jgi:hypothetical protein
MSTRLLDAARKGDYRRGRDARQLDLGYAGSSLALEGSVRSHALQAGDRAPDAPIHRASGTQARLFDLFRGPHWTLLGNAVDRDAIPAHPQLRVHLFGERGDVVDTQGYAREGYGLEPGSWVLVRPDGYVAGFATATNIDTLVAYLQRVGVAVGAEALAYG